MYNFLVIASISLCFSLLSMASEKPVVAASHELCPPVNSLRKSYSIKNVALLAKTLGAETTSLFEVNATKTDKEKQEQEKVEQRVQCPRSNKTPSVSPFQYGTKWEKTLGVGLAAGSAVSEKNMLEVKISKENELTILTQEKDYLSPENKRSPSSQNGPLLTVSSSAVVSLGTSPRTQNYMAQISTKKKPNNNTNHPSGSWCCCWSSN